MSFQVSDEAKMLIDMLSEKLSLKVLILVGFKDTNQVYGGIVVKDEHFETAIPPKILAKHTYRMVLKMLNKAKMEA